MSAKLRKWIGQVCVERVFRGGALLLSGTLMTGILWTTACGKRNDEDVLGDIVHRENYQSVYEKIGAQIRIDMVEERDGKAYVTFDGVEYELVLYHEAVVGAEYPVFPHGT